MQSLLAHFSYLAVIGVLVVAGVGIPIPEEATQLAAGVAAHQGWLSLPLVMAACWVGIVGGDLAWFTLARRHGEQVLSLRAVARVLTPERRARVEAHLARHAFLTVMVARHASGLRLAAFAMAATHGVRPRTFALADGLSALLSVPLMVSLGYLFSQHLEVVHRDLRRVELGILAAVALGAALLALRRRLRARRRA